MNDSARLPTHTHLAALLEAQRVRLGLRRGDLVEGTGLSYQSLQKIMEGTSDFKVSNLLAIAHALDMDVALVPRGLAPALQPAGAAVRAVEPAAPSVVSAALERLRPPSGGPSS